jgi:hypothetical protein
MLDESPYLLEPIMNDTNARPANETEKIILSGKWEHADDHGKIGGDEWAIMQAEVDAAMDDSSEDEEEGAGDSDSWAVLDDVLGEDVSSDEEMDGILDGAISPGAADQHTDESEASPSASELKAGNSQGGLFR